MRIKAFSNKQLAKKVKILEALVLEGVKQYKVLQAKYEQKDLLIQQPTVEQVAKIVSGGTHGKA